MSAKKASMAVEDVHTTDAIAAADVVARGHDLYGTGMGLDHGMALVGAEPPDQEEDDADADVGEGNAHPDLV